MGHYNPLGSAEREIHVLVTGAGPFYSNRINPSFLIAQALPETLRGHGTSARTIHIHALPKPWRVAYQWVREHVPPLLFPPSTSPPPEKDDPYTAGAKPADGAADGDQGVPSTSKSQPNYDVVLFIGMAAPRDYYTLETLAHRDGYLFPDVDGKTMQGDEEWKKLGAPGILKTAFDTEDVWRRWKAELVDEDVRPSNDAGRFLCDFIYFTGLVEYWKHDPHGDCPVMFLHVPGDHTEEAVHRGITVACRLIEALVQSHVERGKL